ncbi:MAG: branched-chain amino acid ABC transporter ATP-binding protein [Deltaproteobacteria bacterium]|nr:MAG: branched-chain amino acid ABC transporter ATP-binding protein [Desulfobacterales bacterium]PIE72517.1 MAG: branched-chain amino acid ABC transporter ATP-binding protein [Deltaproteobacteria bacterium]
MPADAPLIRLSGISKAFGSVQANRDVSLSVQAGRTLALLGENGAGKSTLMSILAGRLQPDSGRIAIDGKEMVLENTEKAIAAGIGMVYQHFMLVQQLSVVENIFLGQKGRLFCNWKEMENEVNELAEQYGMQICPTSRISDLSMGERQQVEILKLLHRQSRVLIFDEPTAVLTPKEIDNLFATIRKMTSIGKGIVFISHKLEEVMALADDIAILKRGEIVDTVATNEVASASELASRMVGREVFLQVDRVPMEPRQVVLKVDGLSDNRLKEIHLELRQGEILGLVGVAGNGQKNLVETICGLRRPQKDCVRILGKGWQKFFSRTIWDNALSYVPEDRQGLATCQGLDLVDNFLLTTRGGFVRGPWLSRERARTKAEHLVKEFDIRVPNVFCCAWQLSGGNLQKLVLAREFFRKPRLIVAEQPTQGLDIAAAEDIWNLLLEARKAAGILLVTGDLSEALALSDRICVMYNGRLVDCFQTTDKQKIEQIPQMMAGLVE